MSALLSAQTATVHKNITAVECTGPNSATVRHELDITIHNQRGEKLCNWVCGCTKDVYDLKQFEAIVTEGNGKVTKVRKSDLGRSEYSKDFATDSYFYYYSPRTSSYPMHIVYRWEESFHSLISFPTFSPVEGFDVAVDSALYRIIAPSSTEIRFHAQNLDAGKVVQREDGKNRITEVSLSHLPAIQDYPDGLPFADLAPVVYFAPTRCNYRGFECNMTDWNTYGKWVYDLQQGRQTLPQELIQKLHALTDTCTTPKSKIGTVRKLMGETTRYVNVSLGIGGFQSRPAAEVYKYGMGDCKALSNYFCAMLHELGLPAVYTLIGKKEIIRDMPNFQQFDHVIVQVPLPDDTLWVECTNPAYPFDYCPAGHRGHDVLLVSEEGGRIGRIPEIADQENQERESLDVYIDKYGDANLKLTRRRKGKFFDYYLGLTEQRNEDLSKMIINSLYLPHPTVKQVKAERQDKQIELLFEAESVGWARSSGSRLFIPITPYPIRKPEKTAAHTVDLRNTGGCEEDSICLHLPEGYAIESIPQSQNIETEFGSYDLQIEVKDNCVFIIRRIRINSGLYDAGKHADWTNFLQQIANLSKKQITLKANAD